MKKITVLTALAAAFLCSLSCEKHDWNDTKMFNQNRTVGGHSAEGHEAVHAEGAANKAPEHPAPVPAPVHE